MISFVVRLTLLTLVISALVVFLPLQFPYLMPPGNVWITIIFFYIITVTIHLLFLQSSRLKSQLSVANSIVIVVVKLIISLIFIILLLILYPQEITRTVTAFFALYLIYTAFELYALFRVLRS